MKFLVILGLFLAQQTALAQTMKGTYSDEVRFTLVLDDYPSKVIVAGSSEASRTRDCVISWIGKFGVREEQN